MRLKLRFIAPVLMACSLVMGLTAWANPAPPAPAPPPYSGPSVDHNAELSRAISTAYAHQQADIALWNQTVWNNTVWNNAVAENQRRAAAAQAAARARVRSQYYGYTAGGGDTFACIRSHESETAGGYGAVNPNGHYGAYQFSQATWNATARRHGRDDLVGVRPDQASPADQDQMARWLQEDSGWGQWSTHSMCGV